MKNNKMILTAKEEKLFVLSRKAIRKVQEASTKDALTNSLRDVDKVLGAANILAEREAAATGRVKNEALYIGIYKALTGVRNNYQGGGLLGTA